MNDELKQIKKLYGEGLMHLSREMFPTILDKEGKLLNILTSNLSPTHSFYNDIRNKYEEEFKNWIYSFYDNEERDLLQIEESPYSLMDKAGYVLYECNSESDIQKFKKYYEEDELICTIANKGRLDRCLVFFAVKKNVDSIKREMFLSPRREDLYGTSVISIQFSRGKNNTLSIKNRYNHTVCNPDSTFSNNLENIIPGLTRSFEKYYHLNINHETNNSSYFLTRDLNYIRASNGKYYRINVEKDGVYYCENNIIIKDGKVNYNYYNNKERYLLIEQYLIDRKEKRISLLDGVSDSFLNSINEIGLITDIKVLKKDNEKEIIITASDKQVQIVVDSTNSIISYTNNYVNNVGSYFLESNHNLRSICLNEVKYISEGFLYENRHASNISIPNAAIIGSLFLRNNEDLLSIYLPNVLTIGSNFLASNSKLKNAYLPKLEIIDDNFLYHNKAMLNIELPSVLEIKNSFMCNNIFLKNIIIPNVLKIGDNFLSCNRAIESISIPTVQKIGDYFLANDRLLNDVHLPKVKSIGSFFLYYNQLLQSISLDEVMFIGHDFLHSNQRLKEFKAENLVSVKNNFLFSNINLEDISLPKFTEYCNGFLNSNVALKNNIVLDNNGLHMKGDLSEKSFNK